MINKRLDKIEDKIDRLADALADANVILAKQNEQLAYHIRRTDLLEEKIKPVQEAVSFFKFATKVLGVLVALAAIYKVTHL